MSNPFQDRERVELNGSVTDMIPVTPNDVELSLCLGSLNSLQTSVGLMCQA